MILQSLFAFFAILAFSIVNEAPRKCLLVNGILGMAGWAIYLYVLEYTTVMFATFISGLTLAIASHIFARVLKSPVTTILIPSILTQDTQMALSSLVSTIGAAGAIAISIFMVDAFVIVIKNTIKKFKIRKLI